MTVYIAKIAEFDIRKYEPNEPGFDLQGYIDWVTSHPVSGNAEPTGAFKNPDDSLTISVILDGYYASEIYVQEGEYGVLMSSPEYESNSINFISEEDFIKNYQPKP